MAVSRSSSSRVVAAAVGAALLVGSLGSARQRRGAHGRVRRELHVRDVEVGHRQASWTRSGQELTVTSSRPPRVGQRFEVEVTYDGVPREFVLPGFDIRTGFMATPDGVTVAGQPEVAAAWFPVNDHPIDKASYSFDVTVPNSYEVVANGVLRNRHRHKGQTVAGASG